MRPEQKYLTTQGFVEHIRVTTGIPLTKSRFQKDRMRDEEGRSVAPEPVARFGNRDLFLETQAPEYIKKLLTPAEAEQAAVV